MTDKRPPLLIQSSHRWPKNLIIHAVKRYSNTSANLNAPNATHKSLKNRREIGMGGRNFGRC
jgi:hypothetical protein